MPFTSVMLMFQFHEGPIKTVCISPEKFGVFVSIP